MFTKYRYILLLLASILCLQTTTTLPIDMYFCTAADHNYFDRVVNLIGSIHCTNYEHTKEIAVFDLGFTDQQKDYLHTLAKVKVCAVEMTHPDLLTPFKINQYRSAPGLYAWKPVAIKQSLEMYPYVLWIDAGSTVLQSLEPVFKHIVQNNYLLVKISHSVEWMTTQYVIKKFNLDSQENKWILKSDGLSAHLIGVTRNMLDSFVMPMYELTKDLRNFQDDGTTPNGFGTGRYDQTLFSVLARLLELDFLDMDFGGGGVTKLTIDSTIVPIHMTWVPHRVTEKTVIYHSRGDISQLEYYKSFIRYKDPQ